MKILNTMFQVMQKKGLKQRDLANYLNINPSVITTWKTRDTNPPTEYIIQICEFLQINLYELFGLENKSEMEHIYNMMTPEDKQIVDIIFNKYKETTKSSISKIG